jgi:hypothetical protein
VFGEHGLSVARETRAEPWCFGGTFRSVRCSSLTSLAQKSTSAAAAAAAASAVPAPKSVVKRELGQEPSSSVSKRSRDVKPAAAPVAPPSKKKGESDKKPIIPPAAAAAAAANRRKSLGKVAESSESEADDSEESDDSEDDEEESETESEAESESDADSGDDDKPLSARLASTGSGKKASRAVPAKSPKASKVSTRARGEPCVHTLIGWDGQSAVKAEIRQKSTKSAPGKKGKGGDDETGTDEKPKRRKKDELEDVHRWWQVCDDRELSTEASH